MVELDDVYIGVLDGIVKWFSYKKGFGHVACHINQQPEDVFVHYSVVPGRHGDKTLHTDESVKLEVYRRNSGPHKDECYASKVLSVVRM